METREQFSGNQNHVQKGSPSKTSSSHLNPAGNQPSSSSELPWASAEKLAEHDSQGTLTMRVRPQGLGILDKSFTFLQAAQQAWQYQGHKNQTHRVPEEGGAAAEPTLSPATNSQLGQVLTSSQEVGGIELSDSWACAGDGSAQQSLPRAGRISLSASTTRPRP